MDAQAETPLLERLALPRRLHERHGQRTLVVFDEFQDVLAAQERADAIIRSEIQHHGDSASYVFSGSHLGMMRELFGDRRRAFYGQAGSVELPPLPPDEVAGYIAECFERTGRWWRRPRPASRRERWASPAHDAARPCRLGAHALRPDGKRGDLGWGRGRSRAQPRRAARDLDIAEAPAIGASLQTSPTTLNASMRRIDVTAARAAEGAQRRESARGPRRDRPG